LKRRVREEVAMARGEGGGMVVERLWIVLRGFRRQDQDVLEIFGGSTCCVESEVSRRKGIRVGFR